MIASRHAACDRPNRAAPPGNVKATREDWLDRALSVLAIEGVGARHGPEPQRPARRFPLELLLVFQEPRRLVRRASGAMGGAQHPLDRHAGARRRQPRSTRRSATSSAAGSTRRSSARGSISRCANGQTLGEGPQRRSTVPTATGPPPIKAMFERFGYRRRGRIGAGARALLHADRLLRARYPRADGSAPGADAALSRSHSPASRRANADTASFLAYAACHADA